MQEIQAAVRAHLQRETGVPAVEEREKGRRYPLLAVTVRKNGTVLVDGGRQAEQGYEATVTALSDREREGASKLLSRVTVALLRGVPMGDRVLHPLDIQTAGDQLTFSLSVCIPLPPREGETTPERMETVHVFMGETTLK